ncbi:MAG: glycosyltransferase family 4 protein [Chitinophagales bacterium]|nr:glycosyltransferase family 4 protein [Chitinophagaceae bacterium]MCB9064651.1 glycosyltransferase family 4 protein [Chitinophagales bacterium]
MKILCVCSGSYVSGKEFVTLDVLEGLVAKGHDVEVMYPGWNDGTFKKELDRIGISSHPIMLGWYYLTKLKWTLDSLVHYPKAIKQFRAVYRRQNPDVVYFDSYRNVFLLKPYINKPIVLHVHDSYSDSTSQKFVRRIDSKTSKYIAVSEFVKKEIEDIGMKSEKVTVVYNGVSQVDNFEKTYLPKGCLRIGIVGQIIPRKGHQDLIEACALIDNKLGFELHVFGYAKDDSWLSTLKELVAEKGLRDNVFWHGFIKDKTKIYDNLDVIAVPTTTEEPFGLISVEAGMHKVPAIVYRSGGLPETVVNKSTGFIVEKGDVKGLSNKLQYFINNKNALIEMGDTSRKNAMQNFVKSTMVDHMETQLTIG